MPVEGLKIRPSHPVNDNPSVGGPKVIGTRMELLHGVVYVFGGHCTAAVYKGNPILMMENKFHPSYSLTNKDL